jgi:hypothetical protein
MKLLFILLSIFPFEPNFAMSLDEFIAYNFVVIRTDKKMLCGGALSGDQVITARHCSGIIGNKHDANFRNKIKSLNIVMLDEKKIKIKRRITSLFTEDKDSITFSLAKKMKKRDKAPVIPRLPYPALLKKGEKIITLYLANPGDQKSTTIPKLKTALSVIQTANAGWYNDALTIIWETLYPDKVSGILPPVFLGGTNLEQLNFRFHIFIDVADSVKNFEDLDQLNLHRLVREKYNESELIQPGNSGSPVLLLDDKNKILGIVGVLSVKITYSTDLMPEALQFHAVAPVM